jgi:hypothetical protein
MNKKKDLEYFLKLNYSVIFIKENDFYCLFIPDLYIIVDDRDLGGAYTKLEKEKETYFRRIIEMNAQDTIKEPTPVLLRKKISLDLIMFSIKTLIIAITFAVVIIASQPILDSFISHELMTLRLKAKTLMLQLPAKVDSKLKSLTPEQKQAFRLQLKSMVQEVKPFVNELQLLWNNEGSKISTPENPINRDNK